MASVSTNKQDYSPGEVVTITLVDITLGGTYTFTITDDPNDPGDDNVVNTYSFQAVDGGAGDADGAADGKITTTWTVPTDGSANNATLNLNATDGSGTVVATTTFTDAVSATIDQWGNGPAPDADGTGNDDEVWQNGNLNEQGAHYAEGEAIPYRAVLNDLTPDAVYSLTIQWDTVDSGAYAIDYLTSYNFTFDGTKHLLEPDVNPTFFTPQSDPGLSSNGVSTVGIPSDSQLLTGFGHGITDGLSSGQPSGAQAFTFFGSVAGLSTSGVSYDADLAKASITVNFTYTGGSGDTADAVVLAWGGHIASSLDWRDDQGETVQTASDISGSPYHMRLLTLTEDGAVEGLGNQDRSLTASTVVPSNPDFTITKVVSDILNPDDSDGGSTVNQAGDKIVYTITVDNTGDVDLTGVTVSDLVEGTTATTVIPTGGDTNSNNILETTETWTYSTTYTVTQDDINTAGTFGNGTTGIQNVATADTDQTGPKSANAEVPASTIEQAPALAIDKTVTSVADTNGNGLTDAGDVINYNVKVSNTGNVTLTGVTVVDPLTGQNISAETIAVGAFKDFASTYTISQADVDGNGGGDGDIDNTATADSDQTGPSSDSEVVPLNLTPAIDIEKLVKVDGAVAFVDADTAATGPNAFEGTPVQFKFTVINTGNVTLSDITVSDSDFDLSGLTGDADGSLAGYQIATLAPSGSVDILYTQTAATAGQHTDTGTASTTFNGSTVSDMDDANYFGFDAGVCGLTPGFWSQHLWAWDGNPGTDGPVDDQGKTLASKLIADDVLTLEDVLIPVDSNRDGVIDGNDQAGVLVGDLNHNGLKDPNETTVFFELIDAQDLINASASTINADQRVKMSRDAIALQLNINNGVVDPDGLITEAAKWLTAQSPYTYGSKSGDVDTNGDWIADYNDSTNVFDGTKVKANDAAWQTLTSGLSGSIIHEAIDDFNNCRLVGGHDGEGKELIGATPDDIILLGLSSQNTSWADWQGVNGLV